MTSTGRTNNDSLTPLSPTTASRLNKTGQCQAHFFLSRRQSLSPPVDLHTIPTWGYHQRGINRDRKLPGSTITNGTACEGTLLLFCGKPDRLVFSPSHRSWKPVHAHSGSPGDHARCNLTSAYLVDPFQRTLTPLSCQSGQPAGKWSLSREPRCPAIRFLSHWV